jgi:hypothetical protein
MQWLALALLLLAAGPSLFGALHWWATVRPPESGRQTGAVTLILPMKPPAADLPGLLRALDGQSLRPRRLIIAVQTTDHTPELPQTSFPCQIVVAGVTAARGQKSHNLLMALDALDAQDQAVIFLDADIVPQPWWLEMLAGPILRAERELVGGFRWSIPEAGNASAQIVAWLDRGWALASRFPALNILWGGSIAFAPAALPSIRRALGTGLLDDLVIAARAREDGQRRLMRGAVLVPSPLDGPGALEFFARQLRLVRYYRPQLWWMQAAHSHAVVLAWLVLPGSPWLALALAMLVARGLAQDAAARRVGVADGTATRLWQGVLSVLPIADAVNLWCIWHSAFGRQLSWRGITYEVAPDGTARVVARQ